MDPPSPDSGRFRHFKFHSGSRFEVVGWIRVSVMTKKIAQSISRIRELCQAGHSLHNFGVVHKKFGDPQKIHNFFGGVYMIHKKIWCFTYDAQFFFDVIQIFWPIFASRVQHLS